LFFCPRERERERERAISRPEGWRVVRSGLKTDGSRRSGPVFPFEVAMAGSTAGDCRTDEMQMPACRRVFPTTGRRTSYGGRS
jgi:hypothetical protein